MPRPWRCWPVQGIFRLELLLVPLNADRELVSSMVLARGRADPMLGSDGSGRLCDEGQSPLQRDLGTWVSRILKCAAPRLGLCSWTQEGMLPPCYK